MKRLVIALAMAAASLVQEGCQSVPPQGYSADARATNRLAELHTQLGVGYMREGNYDVALDRLQRALSVDPDYSAAHNAMALLYEQIGEAEKSERHYRKALELNPDDSAAHTNYGNYLCRRGRSAEGEEQFLQALKNPLYERPETAYTNAGICMYTSGNIDKAENYLRRALEIDPELAPALLRMSELSLEKGRHLQARGYLQRYSDVAEHTAKSLWLGVQIERVLGDRDTVSSYGMLLKAKYPDSTETRLLLESEFQ